MNKRGGVRRSVIIRTTNDSSPRHKTNETGGERETREVRGGRREIRGGREKEQKEIDGR